MKFDYSDNKNNYMTDFFSESAICIVERGFIFFSLFIKKEDFIINYVSVSACSPVIIFKAIYEFIHNFVRSTTPRGTFQFRILSIIYTTMDWQQYHLLV
jgi:hypothetical protein